MGHSAAWDEEGFGAGRPGWPPWAARRAWMMAAGRKRGHGHGHGHEHGGPPFGPGGFGPWGGPGGPGGPGGGPWQGFGPWGRGPRAGRGDVRAAILALLDEGPMHGYQVIQELSGRSGGVWRPSPGSVYPVLQQLQDDRQSILFQAATDLRFESASQAAFIWVRANWQRKTLEYGWRITGQAAAWYFCGSGSSR